MTDPTLETTPTRDEAVRKTTERLRYTASINARRFDDDHPLVGELREAADLIEALASAPAPASGGVDAVSGGLRDAIFAVLCGYRLSNMHCEDEPSCAYPLVDLMSNEGTSIETGELEMRILADEIAGAVYAHADEADLSWAPDALEDAGYTRDFGLQSAFADMADRMIYAENRVAELERENASLSPAATPVSEAAAELRVRHPTRRGPFVISDAELDAALAKPASSPAGGDVRESFASCGQWADETFGPASPQRRLERAGEELNEALTAPTDKLLEEMADTIICIAAAAHSAGGDLQAAIDAKMAVNRARKWSVRGDGTGYHIPDAALSQSTSAGRVGE